MGLWIFLFCVALGFTDAKFLDEAVYAENEQFYLVDKFCFDENGGTLHIAVQSYEEYPQQVIALYHDIPGEGFEGVYDSDASCTKKLQSASLVRSTTANTSSLSKPGGNTWQVEGVQPRWWYVVLANCEYNTEKEGVGLPDVQIEFKNKGGMFYAHFGVEQQGVFQVCIIMFFLTFQLLFWVGCFYRKAKKETNDLSHQVLALIFGTLVLHMMSLVCYLGHYNQYSDDGEGRPLLNDTALIFDAFTHVMLVYIFFVFSKGVYISVAELNSYRTIYELTGLYFVSTLSVLVWEYMSYDPVHMYSPYQSIPGIIAVLLRVYFFFFFTVFMLRTLGEETDYAKKSLYWQMLFMGAVWYLSYPLVAMIATSMSTYNRFKAIFVAEQLFALITYIWMFCMIVCGRGSMKKANDSNKYTTPDESLQEEGMVNDI